MQRRPIKITCIVLALILTVSSLAACSDPGETSGSVSNEANISSGSAVLEFFETLQDNDVVPFTITEKAKAMLSTHEAFFLKNQQEGLDAYTDFSLEYKVLTKNIDKHGDQLIYLPEAYVLSIDETELDAETTLSELHLVDTVGNSFYTLCLSAYPNIYEEDIVSVYALPIGETSFENISGGTTLAIMLAGCYIEEVE